MPVDSISHEEVFDAPLTSLACPDKAQSKADAMSIREQLTKKAASRLNAGPKDGPREGPLRSRRISTGDLPLGANERRKQYAARGTPLELNPLHVRTKKETILVKDIRNLQKYFNELDRDKNGTVDLQEIDAHMCKIYSVGAEDVSAWDKTGFAKTIRKYIQDKDHLDFPASTRLQPFMQRVVHES
ncbi:hypothetical protein CYMTET_27079 [Cymbomonas tetramitiformis]|uniref:EF-hand domain-containing protein n=1 Tax=Cymbomonas tetramitiformis TaxID=36881 RepID=A0AAE0FQH5_9CHLO|nr:hypothetical protein CYMTET_27079 [Cymbomonas tetramitiformis]